jgi:predicted transcriptional regulator
MEKKVTYSWKNKKSIVEVSKALSNPIRVEILKILSYESLSVSEISNKMGLPLTTIASAVNILERAGLITTIIQAGKRGSMKLCSIVYEQIAFNMIKPIDEATYVTKVYDIPLGSYFSADIQPPCGMTSDTEFLGRDDDIKTFYKTNRFQAQLLWFYKGFIEYRIPYDGSKNLERIEISMEVCSEAPSYRLEWPSDITIMINDCEIGTWTCPGDFGGRRGKNTPTWWPINSTQYGLLKSWQLTRDGTSLDYKRITDVSLRDVFQVKNDYISIKIGIKNTAQNVGGINIFGKKFGDYGNGLIASVVYKDK